MFEGRVQCDDKDKVHALRRGCASSVYPGLDGQRHVWDVRRLLHAHAPLTASWPNKGGDMDGSSNKSSNMDSKQGQQHGQQQAQY